MKLWQINWRYQKLEVASTMWLLLNICEVSVEWVFDVPFLQILSTFDSNFDDCSVSAKIRRHRDRQRRVDKFDDSSEMKDSRIRWHRNLKRSSNTKIDPIFSSFFTIQFLILIQVANWLRCSFVKDRAYLNCCKLGKLFKNAQQFVKYLGKQEVATLFYLSTLPEATYEEDLFFKF